MRFWMIGAFMVWAGVAQALDLEALPEADIYVLGEVHDNPWHHLNQARAIAAIRPRAVVWEMIEPGVAMPEDRSNPASMAVALGWQGWPDFALYFPIVEAAGEAVHLGAHVPREAAREAFGAGAAAVFGDRASAFGLDRALSAEEQAQREDEQFSAHCEAMPRAMMAGMVEAQRLRDGVLAATALDAVRAGGPVVVITGNGHARRDRGVPALLAIAAPDVRVLSLGQLEAEPDGEAPWDLWLVTEPAERPDPCLAFR